MRDYRNRGSDYRNQRRRKDFHKAWLGVSMCFREFDGAHRSMKLLMQYLAVAAAGALGAVLRLFVATVSGRIFGTNFPMGTLVINITGSLFLGWFLAMIGTRAAVSETTRLAITAGFIGAYTTFSTFMYESNSLIEDGSGIKAVINLIGSLVAGLLAIRLGIVLGRS